MYKTQLVKDSESNLCLSISSGHCSVIHRLPDILATYDGEALLMYLSNVVPGLLEELKNKRKKGHKRKCENGSTNSLQNSSEETCKILPLK